MLSILMAKCCSSKRVFYRLYDFKEKMLEQKGHKLQLAYRTSGGLRDIMS